MSLRKIHQRINYDLRNIVEWLKANRIASNTDKTKIVLFRTSLKPLSRKKKFELVGKGKK